MKRTKAIKVTLRKKPISMGKRQSLYLDYYPPVLDASTNEFSRREFLNLYLITRPRTPFERIANDENLRTAELIQIRRQNELSKEDIYTEFEKGQLLIKEIGSASFLDYFQKQADKRTGINYEIWMTVKAYFEDFLAGDDITFSSINAALIEDFRDFLLKAKSRRRPCRKLSTNTAHSYFNKIKATLKKAYKDGMLAADINAAVDGIKEQEAQRNFLYIEEARQLFETPCPREIVKTVSLFSILTGLRYSDIEKLEWSEIEYSEFDGPQIRFRQEKTEGQQTLPISEHAYELLGEKRAASNKVFEGLRKWDVDRFLPVWIAAAGITKHITFHCFRHTYATLQLNFGTDIFTVSKMLGHKNVKTTQVYTKIIDQKKRETTSRIRLK